MKRIAFIILMLTVLGFGQGASAHLLPAQNATLNLIGKRAYLVVSVPVSALSGVDDNSDGLLSGEELDRHKAEIGRQVSARFQASSPDGTAKPGFVWVVNPQTDAASPPPTPYLVVLSGVEFAKPPTTVTVRTDLFGRAVGEGLMTLRARSGTKVEIGVLNAQSTSHVFFRGPFSILIDFVRVGVEHILTGPDHLLFLLTVVVVGVSWRYWASVITAFTVAHSITLSLAVFGVLAAPSSLVEPAIAASIVLMGADNLIRKRNVGRERVLLVFACGLLHGLGFASALGEIGVSHGARIASLAGFNIGVELGQAAFVAAVLVVGELLRRALGQKAFAAWPTVVSAVAVIAGAILFIQRLPIRV